MNDDADDPLRLLDREAVPPDLLKARVTASLRQRGLLRAGGTPPVWRMVAAIAAAVALFVAGRASGPRGTATPVAADSQPTWMLLLYEDAAFRYDRTEAEFVAEYSAWAGQLAQRGALVTGEKLDSTAQLLSESQGGVRVAANDAVTSIGVLSGFFIIRAATEREALQIAESCPHLDHGGRIALRPIAKT